MANPATMSDAPAGSRPGRPLDRARRVQPAPPAAPRPATNRRYYVCLAVLVISAATMQATARWLGQHFRKKPVPLKLPLRLMDADKLGPEYELHEVPLPALSEEVEQTLGTDEYLQWMVVDRARERSDPTCVARVFITYYTGQPDMVPHVPDECMIAGGYDPDGPARTVQVPVPGVGAPDGRVPVRVLGFRAARNRLRGVNPGVENDPVTVMYFFHTNGRYATTRNEVRVSQANLLERYAYYAKIEIQFLNYGFSRFAGREESVEALAPLLRKLLPILLKDHLQDWAAIQTGEFEPVENQ